MGKKKTQQQQPQNTPAPVQAKTDKRQKKSAPKQQKPVQKKSDTPAKTKTIKKDQKPSKQQAPVPVPVEKKSKTTKQETNVEIFTPEFYKKLNTFQTYYKEVMELKSSSNNSDLSDELSTVNNRVRELLENASSKILKDELVTLQEWIQTEQNRLRNEIATVEQCLEESQKSLESTKAFSVDEISNQLKLIKKRITEKQSQLDHYGVLLSRSQNIYQQEQAEKAEVQPVQENADNNNNDQELELDDLQ